MSTVSDIYQLRVSVVRAKGGAPSVDQLSRQFFSFYSSVAAKIQLFSI